MAMAEAVRIAGQSSEIRDVAPLPESHESLRRRWCRGSHDLPVIVQAGSVDPGKPPDISAKIAQVDRVAVFATEQHEAAMRLFCSIALKGPSNFRWRPQPDRDR